MEATAMDKLLDILKTVCPDVDFGTETDLIEDGTLTSLDIVMIVSELMAVYDIRIDVDELVPENFKNAASILRLVERAKEN